jgi:hypothetical protein
MKRPVDHDGKSNGAAASENSDSLGTPTYAEIAALAHQLWLEQGQPSDSAERNWLEAERDLRASRVSRSLVEKVQEQAGSVQR